MTKPITRLDRDKSALLVIDMQVKLVNAMSDSTESLSRNHKALLEGARLYEIPTFYSEQYPKGLGPTIDEILEPLKAVDAFRVEKTAYDAALPELVDALAASRRTQLVVTGIETHICVFQTIRSLLELGYEVFVPADAVSSRSAANKKSALRLLSQYGAVVGNTEMFLFDWIKDAKDPHFRALQKTIM